jgi:D-psicose/D-tagatose/L-ribulose 3-epimerase
MKIGLYSVTYRGVWYGGPALDLFSLMRLAKEQGWDGLELDCDRPHAAPMDLSPDDRKRLRDLSGELGLPICAVSPNSDLSSPVGTHREAQICYVGECIKLARDLGSPICKIFAAWRGVTVHDGRGTYDDTHRIDPYRYWKDDRRGFVVDAIRELASLADDHGVLLALQNHGPDIVNSADDVLAMIEEVGSPAFTGCLDISIEPEPESTEHAKRIVKAAGRLQVHSHFNGEFGRGADGAVELLGGGYFDETFWGRKVAYPAYVAALIDAGYVGYMNWEYCHPAKQNGAPAGIQYVHDQTQMALEYMRRLQAIGRTSEAPAAVSSR